MKKPNPPSRLGRLLVNHLGFLCEATKEVVVCYEQHGIFELQDMALNRTAGMGKPEKSQAVLTGTFRLVESPLGTYSAGDFSERTTPGVSRVVLPETGEHSHQFTITDGAFGWLPVMFLRFVYNPKIIRSFSCIVPVRSMDPTSLCASRNWFRRIDLLENL